MKKLFVLAVLALGGCSVDNTDAPKGGPYYDHYVAVCLDGVQYWRNQGIRIDPKTLKPKLCKGE